MIEMFNGSLCILSLCLIKEVCNEIFTRQVLNSFCTVISNPTKLATSYQGQRALYVSNSNILRA